MSRSGKVTSYTERDGATRWRFELDAGPSTATRRRRIRRQGFELQREAKAAMEIERSRYVDVTDPTAVDVGEYLAEWVDRRSAAQAIRPSTARSYRLVAGQAGELLAGIRLNRLSAADLDTAYHRLLTTGGRDGTGRSARTVRLFHSVVRKALGDAVRKGMVPRNVADLADPPSSSAARAPEPDIWTADEVRAFLAAPWLPEYRRVGWELALGTGFRRGELAALQWSDLDGRRLSVRRSLTTDGHRVVEGEPKTAKGRRTITIDDGLAATLRTWRAVQGELLLRIGVAPVTILTNATLERWHPSALGAEWRKDARRAVDGGLVDKAMRLHDCRHWNATQLVAAGVDLNTVADRLGHTTAAFTLAVYGHSDEARDQAAAAAIGSVLGG